MILTVTNFTDASLWPTLFIGGYISTCVILTLFQSDLVRLYILSPTYKAFLKNVTAVHNAGLIVYSAYTCSSLLYAIYNGTQHDPYVMDLCWLFTYSKIWEFLDTYLILAKGQQTIFLQKYHHIGALYCWYLCCYYGSTEIWKVTLYNSFVHTIMYSYYLASLLGYKFTGAKPYITSLQLIQFIAGAVEMYYSYVAPTISEKTVTDLISDGAFMSIGLFYVYVGGLIVLFLQFFISSYCFKKLNNSIRDSV
jgi:hypothetical protein